MTQISGKLVGTIKPYGDVTIELPEVDVSKIKEGDEVWVKMSIDKIHNEFYFSGKGEFGHHFHCDKRYVVYHSNKKAEPKAELPEEIDNVDDEVFTLDMRSIKIAINQIIKVVREQQDTLKQIQEKIERWK